MEPDVGRSKDREAQERQSDGIPELDARGVLARNDSSCYEEQPSGDEPAGRRPKDHEPIEQRVPTRFAAINLGRITRSGQCQPPPIGRCDRVVRGASDGMWVAHPRSLGLVGSWAWCSGRFGEKRRPRYIGGTGRLASAPTRTSTP